MGIINTSPDSFSGDGRTDVSEAVRQALKMLEDGADILDVGGQSTRPGYKAIDPASEIARVVPVIEAIRRKSDAVISVDTTKPEVLAQAIKAGADLLNCVTLPNSDLIDIALAAKIAVVITDDARRDSSEQPNSIHSQPEEITTAVIETLRIAVNKLIAKGFSLDRIIVDPGIGFGKKSQHNIEILANLDKLDVLGLPILIGTSRKSFLHGLTGRPVDDRDFATAATVALAIAKGADILRVHNVEKMIDVVRVSDALVRGLQITGEEISL